MWGRYGEPPALRLDHAPQADKNARMDYNIIRSKFGDIFTQRDEVIEAVTPELVRIRIANAEAIHAK